MASPKHVTESEARTATAITVQPSSPRFPLGETDRKIGIAVDLSDESAFAVRWAVLNYLRRGDTVILLHVRSTNVLYGADWGAIEEPEAGSAKSQQKLEDDFDAFTTSKANDLAQPLVEAQIPFKIHIVKDHDMKERLCLEVERLGLSTVVTGSRGFGASRRNSKSRLGSVSDYCVHHCVCPVVVVRFPEEKDEDEDDDEDEDVNENENENENVNGNGNGNVNVISHSRGKSAAEDELEYHDALDKQSGTFLSLSLFGTFYIFQKKKKKIVIDLIVCEINR